MASFSIKAAIMQKESHVTTSKNKNSHSYFQDK